MKFTPTLLLGGIFAIAKAFPVSKANSTVGIRDFTVTQTVLDNFHYFAQYSAASYCSSNNDNSPGPISCLNNACPLVCAANAATVLEFDIGSPDSMDVFGFVAIDPAKSLIVVAFRGSDSVRNWIANVQIALVDTPICSSCKVHEGFNKAWLERQLSIIAAINSAKAANPSYGIVVTGHSLGAAVATIAGAYLRSTGINCDIYTYGSPRVGNQNFANYVSSTSQGLTSRLTHFTDPVPHLPVGGNLAWLTDYYHTSPEYFLYDGGVTTDTYGVSDIKICTGINNQNCAENVHILDWDIQAHEHYFEKVTGCDSTFTFK